jgi:urocanate hydratase
MASEISIAGELRAELEAVYAIYAALARALHPETGLGGKLLYAGELDIGGSRLVRAANIAGAASLGAVPDAAMQRSTIREGVVDFVVTSLDEALRILKNEIRKQNAVSVGVAVSHEQLLREMHNRGVLPDLLRGDIAAGMAEFVALGAKPLKPCSTQQLFTFQSISSELEERALNVIPESDYAARRWFRLSHRYLGPQARRIRSVPANAAVAAALGSQ